MSLDNRLQKQIQDLATQIPTDPEANLGTVMRTGQRRRVVRRTTAALGVIALLLIALYSTGGLLSNLGVQHVDTAGRPNETKKSGNEPSAETGGESTSGSPPKTSRSEQPGSSSSESRSSGSGSNPNRSRDLDMIAFNRSLDIYLIGVDGSGLRHMADGVAPSWSPDGRRIAFSSGSAGGNLQLINRDGSGRHNLGASGALPEWSPDGDRLVFNWQYDSSKLGCRPAEESQGHPGPECGIGVVGADGNRLQWIGTGRWPDWGADNRIVFGDGMPEQPCRYGSTLSGAILDTAARADRVPQCHLPLWVMHPDGSARVRLPIERAIAPKWSPDGKKIAYYQEYAGVSIANADGTGSINVAPAGYSEPSWSPDGKRLAVTRGYIAEGRRFWSIYVVSVDGSSPRQLTSGAIDTLPSVSP